MKWQTVATILTLMLASSGVIYLDGLFGVLFQLKGIEYNYTGDIVCGSECESFIDLETSYWRVCFAGYNDTKYENKTLFKKVSRSRTLHVNMDNVDNIITTQRLLLNGSYESYDIGVDWLVPARGKGNWRSIKDGDCWDRKKVNRIKLVGHKNPDDTIKWSFGIDSYVDIDPLWKADEKNETDIIDITDKKILGNPYSLNLSDDNIDSFKNLTTNTCYSETDDMIIIVDNCHQEYAEKLIYEIKLINKQDKFLFYDFLISSGNDIDDSVIGKKRVEYKGKDLIGKTKDRFYGLNPFIFKPNETIHFNYTIYPKEISGEFNFIGYDSYKDLENSIKDKRYIFLDPTWDDAKVSYWNADTSGSFPDEWGGHDGTIDGATYNATGKINGAYEFDRDNTDKIYIDSHADYAFGTGGFSMAFWVKLNNLGVYQIPLSKATNNGAWSGFFVIITTTNAVELYCGDNTVNRVVTPVNAVNQDIWYHIVGTRNESGTISVYINGTLEATKYESSTASVTTTNKVVIGTADLESYYLNGTADELAIWDRALTQAEITDIYNKGIAQPPPTYSENSTNSTLINMDIDHKLRWEDKLNLTDGGYTFYYFNGTTYYDGDISDDRESDIQNFYGEYITQTFDYFDDFEAGLGNNWSQMTDDDYDWVRGSSTPSGLTGANIGGASSTYFLFTESSGKYNRHYHLLSHQIDFDDYSKENIHFYYHMYGAAMGTLTLAENSTGSWETLWTKTGQQSTGHTDWKNDNVDLSDLTGTGHLRFDGLTGTAYTSDMCIDQINITSSEHISKDSNGTAVVYSDVMSDVVSETIVNITVTVYVSEYNSSGSIETENTNITIWLEAYNSTDWIDLGDFSANETGNFTRLITTGSVLSSWQTVANRDIRISARYIDYNTTGMYDIINWTGVWVEIDSKQEYVADSFVEFSSSNCDNDTICWSNVTKHSPSIVGTKIKWRVKANNTGGVLNESEVFEYTLTSSGADTCSCPASGTNWGWDFADNCTIAADCDIGTGKVYVLNTNAGIWTINAVVTGSKDSTLNGSTGQYITGNGHLNLTVG